MEKASRDAPRRLTKRGARTRVLLVGLRLTKRHKAPIAVGSCGWGFAFSGSRPEGLSWGAAGRRLPETEGLGCQRLSSCGCACLPQWPVKQRSARLLAPSFLLSIDSGQHWRLASLGLRTCRLLHEPMFDRMLLPAPQATDAQMRWGALRGHHLLKASQGYGQQGGDLRRRHERSQVGRRCSGVHVVSCVCRNQLAQ